MTAENWPRVEELFHQASLLGAVERDEYLARECAGDEALRREVESLVTAFESNRSFMERPLLSDGLRALYGRTSGSLAGCSLGHYKIERMLDGGGMGGEVYLADDCKLERPVALKFIFNHYAGDDWAREQMMQEARAVARLEHTHICQVYDVEEIEGHHFIVMQYVKGETLASLMRRGRLAPERAAELAEQIACALAFAHARGVIHRDVKPQNIMVTAAGEAKVLDFGLAKFVSPQREAAGDGEDPEQTLHLGGVVGTPAYMSPEQARGEGLDFRGDIFSFGVVLYEMLSGHNPFLRGTVEETLSSILQDEPPPLPSPAALGEIALQCLAKERGRRPASADVIVRRLRGLHAPEPAPAPPPAPAPARFHTLRRHARPLAAAALALLLLSALVAYAYLKLSRVHTLAVLPIINQSDDREADYLSQGLTRNLSDKFSYLPRMRVRLPSVVPPGRGGSDELAQLGRELQADAVLSGQVFKQGDALRLRLILLSAPDAAQLWEHTFDLNNAASIFLLQDEVTRQVSSRLDLWLVGGERKLLSRRQTDSEEALRLYMRGRYYLTRARTRENVEEAIRVFDRAVELDPSFAQAYTGLADCYVLRVNVAYGPVSTQQAMEKAGYNARQALALDDSLSEAHTSMGVVKMMYGWDWPGAEREFKRAIELDPEYAQAHFGYSNLLAARGRFDESLGESLIAKGLDPYSTTSAMNYGRALYYARRSDEAEAYFRGLLAESPNDPGYQHMTGLVLLQQGRYQEAVEVLERLHAVGENKRRSAAALGFAYGKAGRREDAFRMIDELRAMSTPEAPMPALEEALVYIGLGDRDQAFARLYECYETRFGIIAHLTADSLYDDLRPDPRFAELARRLNLTP